MLIRFAVGSVPLGSITEHRLPGAYLHYDLFLGDVALLIVPMTGEFLHKQSAGRQQPNVNIQHCYVRSDAHKLSI